VWGRKGTRGTFRERRKGSEDTQNRGGGRVGYEKGKNGFVRRDKGRAKWKEDWGNDELERVIKLSLCRGRGGRRAWKRRKKDGSATDPPGKRRRKRWRGGAESGAGRTQTEAKKEKTFRL